LIEKEVEAEEAQKLLEQQLAEENMAVLTEDVHEPLHFPSGGWYSITQQQNTRKERLV